MIGIIDIGSNTVRLNIYKIYDDSYQLLVTEKEMVGLANHIVNHEMMASGVDAAVAILNHFVLISNNLNCQKIYAFATASLRNISNSSSIVDEISQRTHLFIDVLTGDQEAQLGFLGATQEVDVETGLLVDIGGGSTELVYFEEKQVVISTSIPMGSLTSYRDFVEDILPRTNELKALSIAFDRELSVRVKTPIDINTIVGIGGTARATFELIDELKQATCDDVLTLLKQLSNGSKASTNVILKKVPDRIHTILPGMQLLSEVLKYFNSKDIYISHSGVREGYLLKEVLRR